MGKTDGGGGKAKGALTVPAAGSGKQGGKRGKSKAAVGAASASSDPSTGKATLSEASATPSTNRFTGPGLNLRVFKLVRPVDPDGRVRLDSHEVGPLLVPEEDAAAAGGSGFSAFDLLGDPATVEAGWVQVRLSTDPHRRLAQLLAIQAFLHAVADDDLRVTRQCSAGRVCDP